MIEYDFPPFDPEQPRPSIPCREEQHEACDQFGWLPWCECDCHVPDVITGVCYHGRHDLCPKQPSEASGLSRCICSCHEEKSDE